MMDVKLVFSCSRDNPVADIALSLFASYVPGAMPLAAMGFPVLQLPYEYITRLFNNYVCLLKIFSFNFWQILVIIATWINVAARYLLTCMKNKMIETVFNDNLGTVTFRNRFFRFSAHSFNPSIIHFFSLPSFFSFRLPQSYSTHSQL